MVQELGETSAAIIEDDNRQLQAIIDANSNRLDPYWVVIAAKPVRNSIKGRPVLRKFIKAYAKRPISQVGMIIGEVNNQTGEIKWEINMPDAPINYDGLVAVGAKPGKEVVVDTTTIPHAYITQ